MIVHRSRARLAGARLGPRPRALQMTHEELVALARALAGANAHRRVRAPRHRRRQLLLDVLVRRHLDREVHQLGLLALRELRVREMAEHHVMHLVEQHAAQVLRLRDERVDVDVQEEAAVVQRDGHARDRRIRDRRELGEDRRVVRIRLEERRIADEPVEPRLELAPRALGRLRAHRGHPPGRTGVMPTRLSVSTSGIA